MQTPMGVYMDSGESPLAGDDSLGGNWTVSRGLSSPPGGSSSRLASPGSCPGCSRSLHAACKGTSSPVN